MNQILQISGYLFEFFFEYLIHLFIHIAILAVNNFSTQMKTKIVF